MVYIIEMSNKRNIQIDQDELPNVLQGINSGHSVIVRQGIFNPSFYIDIVEDKKRIEELEKLNNSIKNYADPVKLEQLPNIFKDIKLIK